MAKVGELPLVKVGNRKTVSVPLRRGLWCAKTPSISRFSRGTEYNGPGLEEIRARIQELRHEIEELRRIWLKLDVSLLS